MSMMDDPDRGIPDLTEEQRKRTFKARKDMRATQLGCLAMLLAIAVLWFVVGHLFEWCMGWRDSWW